MNRLAITLCAAAFAGLGACSGSSSGSGVDQNIQARIASLTGCLPDIYRRFHILLDVVETWRLNTSSMVPDPTGLTWSERTDGVVQVDYDAGSGLPALDMQITFFDPTGVPQNLNLTGATTLGDVVDIAAAALATTSSSRPFLTADWSLRDTMSVIFGAGTFTATLGSTTNQNIIDSISTTLGSSVAVGGPPAAATATIAVANPGLCTAVIDIPDLQIDAGATQQYPIGTVTFAITADQNALTTTATVLFTNTTLATVTVADVPGSYTLNLDTFVIQ